MTFTEAKAITMPILLRIARHMPVKGYLAECGVQQAFFNTLEQAQRWIYSRPSWAKMDANEMPSISFGYYKHLIIPIP